MGEIVLCKLRVTAPRCRIHAEKIEKVPCEEGTDGNPTERERAEDVHLFNPDSMEFQKKYRHVDGIMRPSRDAQSLVPDISQIVHKHVELVEGVALNGEEQICLEPLFVHELCRFLGALEVERIMLQEERVLPQWILAQRYWIVGRYDNVGIKEQGGSN